MPNYPKRGQRMAKSTAKTKTFKPCASCKTKAKCKAAGKCMKKK
jgi:hypothetical protein